MLQSANGEAAYDYIKNIGGCEKTEFVSNVIHLFLIHQ